MIVDILNKMAEIVANTMTSFQSDFEKYDRPYIESITPEQFPLLWFVAPSHTYLLRLGEYRNHFFNEESYRYAYAAGDNTWSYYLETCASDRIFLIDVKGVNEIDISHAERIIDDIVSSTVTEWSDSGYLLPTDIKMPIKFSNITLGKLKELIADCRKHDDNSLADIFHRFRHYRRTAENQYIQISYNSYYNEFTFCQYTNWKQGLVGGIIFHGWSESGYQSNYAVQLDPKYGWATHT